MTRAVERAAREWSRSGAHEPLEIAQAIVDTVAERLEPAARGRYVFPFNRIHVTIAASSRDDRARFAAVFESEPTLQQRIAARLRDAGCDPRRCSVSSPTRRGRRGLADARLSRRVHTRGGGTAPVASCRAACPEACSTRLPARRRRPLASSGSPSSTARPKNELRLCAATGESRACAEVRDSLSRLVRTNHVAFVDSAGTSNHSVSRRHAHIEYVERAALPPS